LHYDSRICTLRQIQNATKSYILDLKKGQIVNILLASDKGEKLVVMYEAAKEDKIE
jgi:hypothetical protein